MADMKAAYTAVDEENNLDALEAFLRSGTANIPKYQSHGTKTDPISVRISRFSETDLYHIEGFNRQLKKVTKAKSVFPTDDSFFKMLFLAMKDITKKWTCRRQDWSSIYAQLVIYYGDRIQE